MNYFHTQWPWFRGNLHLHTTRSDGQYTPEAAEALYRTQGYDFIAFTDHRQASDDAVDDGFLRLSGVELDTMTDGQAIHVVGIGMEHPLEAPPLHSGAQGMIDSIRNAGGRAMLAHPAWSLLQPGTIAGLQGLTAVEVFNSVSRPPWNGERAEAANLLDLAWNVGARLPWVAVDDVHFYKGDEIGGWIWVNAPELSRDAILDALDAGHFFASTGPRFSQISLENGVLSIQCSPVERAIFYSNLHYVHHRVSDFPGEAYQYQPQTGETFIRVEIIDQQGRKAWSSPIALV